MIHFDEFSQVITFGRFKTWRLEDAIEEDPYCIQRMIDNGQISVTERIQSDIEEIITEHEYLRDKEYREENFEFVRDFLFGGGDY